MRLTYVLVRVKMRNAREKETLLENSSKRLDAYTYKGSRSRQGGAIMIQCHAAILCGLCMFVGLFLGMLIGIGLGMDIGCKRKN